jgi:hypothetical protein
MPVTGGLQEPKEQDKAEHPRCNAGDRAYLSLFFLESCSFRSQVK